MSKKFAGDKGGFVYSTDPNFRFEEENEQIQTLPPNEQNLFIQLDNKQRGGKTVTLISGFVGTEADLDIIAKQLRSHCGTGGSAKDGFAIVQGDQRDKVFQWLQKNGYTKTKRK
ncbi:MAG: translation initiation factor [Sediminibacterium sp.]|jgi:translation initiation factor 1